MKLKQLTILFVTFCLMFAQYAQAKRFGGGRSYGTRSLYSNSYARGNSYSNNTGASGHSNYSPGYTQSQSNTSNQSATQQRHGIGAGTAAALGAAAGAAGGYMLGRSMGENGAQTNQEISNKQSASGNVNNSGINNQETQVSPQGSPASYNNMLNRIPWGVIAILIILLIIGLVFFRNKIPANSRPNNDAREITQEEIQRFVNNQKQQQNNNIQQNPNIAPNVANKIMPDGVEAIYFLRQVKGMFLHIQSMNNSENINEIKKYMTQELYDQMYNEIVNNTDIADFQRLECNLTGSSEDNDYFFASVEFRGMVSEEVKQTPVEFCEIWNFIKPKIGAQRWLIAGIEQVANSTSTQPHPPSA